MKRLIENLFIFGVSDSYLSKAYLPGFCDHDCLRELIERPLIGQNRTFAI